MTFGEVMLRLKSPGFETLLQTPGLEATFGGAEANVAVSLAQFGMSASFVSALPANHVADACIRELNGFGVDTSHLQR
ncbi:MAG: PfkB family carbohydrate kinase, partial [Gemmatimonadaceae bacterium]